MAKVTKYPYSTKTGGIICVVVGILVLSVGIVYEGVGDVALLGFGGGFLGVGLVTLFLKEKK